MGKPIRYYLGRVLKRGEMTWDKIAEAMRDPVTIEYRGTKYSFIDFEVFDGPGEELGFVAKIAKYRHQGAVDVVHEVQHASVEASVVNLIDATSAFVYLPGFSGLAYRHVWNSFPSDQFERVFKELIETKYQKFFVGCDIEPVTDLRTFVSRLSRLERITELNATVVPPNPMFGPCWKSLFEYMKKRRLTEASIKEHAEVGIETRLKEIANAILREQDPQKIVVLMEPLLGGVGDAALLMAADGYGRARVVGREDNHDVIIRTSDNQKSFMIEGGHSSQMLYELALHEYRKNTFERGLEHP
jgi:hypothetical protein